MIASRYATGTKPRMSTQGRKVAQGVAEAALDTASSMGRMVVPRRWALLREGRSGAGPLLGTNRRRQNQTLKLWPVGNEVLEELWRVKLLGNPSDGR